MSGKILIPARAFIESSQCLTGDPLGEFVDFANVSAMNCSMVERIGESEASPLFCDRLFSCLMLTFVSPPKTISSNLSFRILNSFTATGYNLRGFFFSGRVAGIRYLYVLSSGMWVVSFRSLLSPYR